MGVGVAPRHRGLAWPAFALACAAAFCVLDRLVDDVVFLAGVMVAPLLTAFRSDRRTTAWVAVIALAMALVVAAFSPGEDGAQRAVSVGLGALASFVAYRFAGMREGRERTARWLAAQQEVARIGAEGAPLEEAAPRMLRAIGRALAWDVALLWERDRAAGVLRCVATWHAPGRDVTAFEALVAQREFPCGKGLPGEVWERGVPAWIDDVADLARYTRAEAAVASGLRTGFAFPTLAGDEVLGVIEAYTAEPRVPDRELIEIMSTFGTQMAKYIEALRAHEAVRAGEAEVRRSRDELSATLGNLADAVTVQDRDGRLVYANEAAARMLGFATTDELLAVPSEQVIERFEVFDEHGRPLDAEALPGWRTLAGERPDPVVIRFRSRTAREDRWAIVKSTAVRDRDGGVVRAVNVVEDITEQKRAEIAQRFLAEASRLLGASLDYATTLNSVAEVAVPSFADWCAVDVVGDDGTLRRVAVAHGDAAHAEQVRQAMAPHAPARDGDHPVAEAIRTGEPKLLRDDGGELNGKGLAWLRAAGIRSALIVPLPAWRRVLGAISFVNAESARGFDEHDLALAEEVGRRAATAMENARLYGELAETARTLQQSLLPPHLPEIAGLDVAARYRPAGEGIEVGGDFYDLFDTGDARWAVVIGDVCGKGAGAAATTALARYTLRAAAMRERRPGRVLEQLNEAMLRQRTDRQFATVAYASVDVGAHGAVLTLACGGHPPPLIVRREGGVEVAPAAGTLLGVVADPDLNETTVELAPGDAIVLYTDGVTEARTSSGLFGLEGLVAVAGEAAGLPAAEVARRVEAAAAVAGEVRDDLAVVVLRVPEGPTRPASAVPVPGERGSLDVLLPSSPQAIRSARQALDRLALDVGERKLEELRLLVSEVVTNALRHGSRGAEDWIGLRVRSEDDRVHVEVTDAGEGFEARVREARPDATGGWGLYLVERLAERWGVERGERTTVWFDLAVG